MFGLVAGFALTAAAAAAVAVAAVGDLPAELRSIPARTTAAVSSRTVPICNARRRRNILHLRSSEFRSLQQWGTA